MGLIFSLIVKKGYKSNPILQTPIIYPNKTKTKICDLWYVLGPLHITSPSPFSPETKEVHKVYALSKVQYTL